MTLANWGPPDRSPIPPSGRYRIGGVQIAADIPGRHPQRPVARQRQMRIVLTDPGALGEHLRHRHSDIGRAADIRQSLPNPGLHRLRRRRDHQRMHPPVNDRYCPDQAVTRQQMAAFLRRALENG